MKRFSVLIALLLGYNLCVNCTLNAQSTLDFPPPDDPQKISVQRAVGKIQLDGRLDEADWAKAEVISGFFRREPRQGGKVKYETEVRFLYDAKYLYVGAFCKDSLGIDAIRIQDLRRDFGWGNNDGFGIALDPQNLKQYAQVFQTTPYGNQRDLQNFNGNNSDVGWNTLWKVRTHRTEEGYYTEFAIPFKSLRYDKTEAGAPIEWGVILHRFARRDYEVSSFPAIPQSISEYRMTYAAILTDIEVPPPSANIRVEPYSLFQYDDLESMNGNSSNGELKLGGDIKWAINPRSVLDVTFNTDFAQADVDRAVNNLGRFNIFFPEQRQFFLENSGIWAGASQRSIRPFFSRRIGLQGEFNAAPAPIEFGTRYTQRTEDEAIAGLFVRQGETNNSQTSNFGVLRYLKNYGRENNVGIMLTHRNDENHNSLDLSSNNNTTITIDGQIWPSNVVNVNYLVSTSIDQKTGKTGYAGRFFAGNRSNTWYYGWSTEFIDDNYNPGIGFIRQQNLVSHNPGGYFIWRPKNFDWIRRWDPGAFISYNHDATDPSSFQQASIYIFPIYTWFRDNSFLELSLTPTWQNINFRFAPLGLEIENGEYYYTRYTLRYYTDQSKKWSLNMSSNFGDFYNGTRSSYFVSGRLAPIPQFNFTMSYEHNDLRNVGVLEDDLLTDLITVGTRFALNPRVQFSSFYQYNSFDDQGRWNIRASWEYQPLSFIYFVLNDSRIDNDLQFFQEQQLISKITFTKQF